MNTTEIISIVLNFLLGSGLLGTIIFYRAKSRKEYAEASLAEHNSDAEAISNAHDSAIEWKEIAKAAQAEVKELRNKLEKVWDYLRKEQTAHAKTAKELSLAHIELERKEPQICNVRGCNTRTPPSDY